MPSSEPETLSQKCPVCGLVVDVTEQEPLARVECPGCGEKFRIERTFDNFELLETLGVGGMGSVYKARDTRLDRFVALKILRKELSADPSEARRLEQEARATAAVNDPHVVQVFSSGTDHGQFYLVMELVDFGSLDDLMAQHGRLLEAEILETGLQVAKGLKAAYEKGLIHRDIKPGNILFGSEHAAKIGDFGLAVAAGQNAESQNEIWGTPYYVAPERLNNEPEDFRSDIYSLGATLYHAIAGRPPIEGETNSASALRDLKNNPLSLAEAAPGLRRETVRTLDRMVAPDPNARFASYDELIEHLAGAVEALNPSVQKPKRRRRILAALAVVLLLAAGAAYLYEAKQRRAIAGRTPVEDLTLQHLYENARGELIAGKSESARTAFTRLSTEAQNKQPLLSWIRLHRGLANLIRGFTTQARQAFQELEAAGPFSKKPEDAALAAFFIDTARTMNTPDPVPAGAARVPDPKGPQSFALLLFAMKDWQLSDFANAAALLEQFVKSEPAGAASWINDYKPFAQKYLTDYRIYADWKKQPPPLDNAEQIQAALKTLRDSQNKLQLRGRLNEVYKEEETKLTRRLAEIQKPH
jgi:serine/threonine protein kinase